MKLSLRIHPAGLLWMAALFLWGESKETLAVLLALCLHEGFHLLPMALYGIKVCQLELTPFGGVADVHGFDKLSPAKQCVIAAAGVAGSAAAALLCRWLVPSGLFWQKLYTSNLSLALLNCLPVFPLDGSRIVLAVIGRLGYEQQARKGLLWLAYGLCIALLALGVYSVFLGQINPMLFFFPPYLAYAAHESALCGTIRKVDDLLGQKREMHPGQLKEVQAYACYGQPHRLLLSRLWKKMSVQKTFVLHVLDEYDGSPKEALWEGELARKLFDDPLDKRNDFPPGMQ